jgi:hypothetical protein
MNIIQHNPDTITTKIFIIQIIILIVVSGKTRQGLSLPALFCYLLCVGLVGLFVFIPHISRHIGHTQVTRCTILTGSISTLVTLAKIFVQKIGAQVIVESHNSNLLYHFVVQVVPDDASIAHHAEWSNWQICQRIC